MRQGLKACGLFFNGVEDGDRFEIELRTLPKVVALFEYANPSGWRIESIRPAGVALWVCSPAGDGTILIPIHSLRSSSYLNAAYMPMARAP